MVAAGVLAALALGGRAATCPDDPDSDLCDATSTPTPTEPPPSDLAQRGARGGLLVSLPLLFMAGLGGQDTARLPLALVIAQSAFLAAGEAQAPSTCGDVKSFYKTEGCCGAPEKELSTSSPSWACTSVSGVCECERMTKALAGVPGASFPTTFCSDMQQLKPVGHRSAQICEATDAGSDASLLVDGKPGNTNFPHGMLKVLATVGEVNPRTGAMLTGVPDGNGAYLKSAGVVRVIYQSESYGPLHRQETFPFFVNGGEHVGFTGSHIHFIDLNRSLLAQFLSDGAPASAEHMVLDSGEAVLKVYNLKRELVGKRSAPTSSKAHDSNVNITGDYIVRAVPTKADWLMQSLCSAHLAPAFQWGEGVGVQDDLFLTNEEWISYLPDTQGIIGLPAHVLNIATGELWALSTFGLGGFEKIVEVNSGTKDFVAFVPSGYNGAFGGSFPQVVAQRNGNYTRSDSQPYVWTQNILPTRLYLGKKATDKDGNADNTNFLARNGFEFGALYGFATDCSAGTPGAEGRDAWHKNTATSGANVTGAFYRLKWKDTPGAVRDFIHDAAWEFQDAPEGAPAGWCWWNGKGKDAAGAKTEHVSPDPRGGARVLQGSTAGYFGIYDFSGVASLLEGGAFPQSIPATYTCLQPEKDITSMIELGGAGKYADGQDATVNPDKGQNPGKTTFEDIDGLEWIAAAGGEDYVVIHEDSGNDFGERKFLAKVGTPMKYYFVAMSGGVKNSRQLAKVSAVAGVTKAPNSHEFSGATDLSGLLAKDASGAFKLPAGAQNGKGRSIAAEVPVDAKDIVVTLQAHSNWGGWTESFHPDAVGQLFVYRPKMPASASR